MTEIVRIALAAEALRFRLKGDARDMIRELFAIFANCEKVTNGHSHKKPNVLSLEEIQTLGGMGLDLLDAEDEANEG